MSVPPALLHVSIARRGDRGFRLWLPLFLLWPLVLALALLGLVLAAVADAMLALLGRRYHHCTSLLLRTLAALAETRGTAVSFSTATSAVDVTVT